VVPMMTRVVGVVVFVSRLPHVVVHRSILVDVAGVAACDCHQHERAKTTYVYTILCRGAKRCFQTQFVSFISFLFYFFFNLAQKMDDRIESHSTTFFRSPSQFTINYRLHQISTEKSRDLFLTHTQVISSGDYYISPFPAVFFFSSHCSKKIPVYVKLMNKTMVDVLRVGGVYLGATSVLLYIGWQYPKRRERRKEHRQNEKRARWRWENGYRVPTRTITAQPASRMQRAPMCDHKTRS
jgi:hypothetical protein